MPTKFKLTAECKEFLGIKLFRIEALIDIAAAGVKAGDEGGFVEKEANLADNGNAWVSGNAWVYGDARVSGNAWVYGNARVYGNAWVSGNARVYGNAWVYGDARVYGNARVSRPICAATRSDGYTFVVAATPDGARIIAGCRYFTFDEARKHWAATRGGTPLGDESLALVDHLERMAGILGLNEPVKAEG